MIFKSIIFGQFDFGGTKSFQRVVDMSIQRAETYYRSDILFDLEEAFDEEKGQFILPKKSHTHQHERPFKNSLNLLKHIAQFATSGRVRFWLLENGQLKHQFTIEPLNDHATVKAFLRGRKLAGGNPEKAVEAFTEAIAHNEQHAEAYHQRALTWLQLNKIDQAKNDLAKSIQHSPTQPDAYFDRATLFHANENFEQAAQDYGHAIQYSIPHQPFYWASRRKKADCLMAIEDYRSAETEWRLLSRKKFNVDNPNHPYELYVQYQYGKTLLEMNKPEEALKVLDAAVKLDFQDNEHIALADLLFLRCMAMKNAGRKGFLGALKEAAQAGSVEAADMLDQ